MKTVVIAAILFSLPIIGVVAMNPEEAQQSLKEARDWAETVSYTHLTLPTKA